MTQKCQETEEGGLTVRRNGGKMEKVKYGNYIQIRKMTGINKIINIIGNIH